jgi:hypothetical protein
MTEERIWTEAPACVSVELRFEGYRCTLTLRGETGGDVLPKLETALAWLAERGAEPIAADVAVQEGSDSGNDAGAGAHICPIHQVKMQRREKQGDVWYSHKAVDPETGAEFWCRGEREA